MTLTLHSEFMARMRGHMFAASTIRLLEEATRGGVLPEGWDGDPKSLRFPVQQVPIRELPSVSDGVLVSGSGSTDRLPVVPDSGFVFGKSSEKELIGVRPELIECARQALKRSEQDFIVYDGIRSIAEQRHYVQIGTSQTMESKHLPQPDGFGHALDLVPWIGGRPVWDWQGCYKIAAAMDVAATLMGIANRIRWGGAWDRRLSDFESNPTAYAKAVEQYRARHAGKDFIDGPHFEWA